ncbi:MAG: DUF547 domain-containing protein [Endozoicomonas sp.]|uniref:DUF547 domain-containing protein n=1 Tax=Endozoicomonas sp. TaxID=1892382 RepID=UPI003D9B794D
MRSVWIAFFIVVPLLLAGQVEAAPEKDYWAFWDKSDESNRQEVDHSQWQYIIDKYLRYSDKYKMYVFVYGGVSRENYARLQTYLKGMSGIDPRELRKKEQLAYWINLYNALTVELILKNYPVKSITRLGKGWFRTGPWKDKVINIQGQPVSLHDIEHRIIRPLWNTPRIHYAINCASIGCPDLAPKTYKSSEIEAQLDEAGTRFINQNKGVNFVGGRLVLSKIFYWYGSDFGGKDGVMKELLRFSDPKMRKRIEDYQGGISYHYNWKLNEYRR